MARIFTYIVHQGGVVDDTAAELLAASRKINASEAPTAIMAGSGPNLNAVCVSLCASFGEVWKIDNAALGYPNAELVRKALVSVVPFGSILLVPHSHFGVDLSPGLSIKLRAAFISDVVGIDGTEGSSLKVLRQEFDGQVSTRVVCDISCGAVINIRPGAFERVENAPANGTIVDKSGEVGKLEAKRRYLETVVAESGDVDVTKHQILVSIGRGIQEADNVAIAEKLAAELGGAVSCSRPVVDAKWMDKSRQVGSSGRTVKPKVYLACGISGSFQHLAGIKGSPFIVAINKNPQAPIFRVANVGIVDDILEFLPAMTNKLLEQRSVAAKAR